MKKTILSLLLGAFIMTGLSANPSRASGTVAVVYFSATGTTERMAKNAAQAMGADLFEIEPVHKYTDADLNWHDKKSLTTIECNDPKSRPAIANKIDISSYDTVVLCYPIWWAYAPKIVYTFVESQNWSGKILSPSAHQAEAVLAEAARILLNSQKVQCSKAEKTLHAVAARMLRTMLKG